MLHYPEVMHRIGSLWSVCCLRWEAKHRPLKLAAHATNSRKNLPLTLAIKHQLNLCARFLSRKPLGEKYSFGVEEELSIKDLKNYELFHDILPKDLNEIIKVYSWIRISGTIFKKGICVAVSFHKDTDYPVYLVELTLSHIVKNLMLFIFFCVCLKPCILWNIFAVMK